MAGNRNNRVYGHQCLKRPRKPNAFNLLGHIVRAVISGGLLWMACLGGAFLAYLHSNQVPIDGLLALLIVAVAGSALLRGIRSWQADNAEYQQDLTEYRINLAEVQKRHRVRKAIAWDRN